MSATPALLSPLAVALLLATGHLALRLAPVWPHRRQGCDAYYYLLCAEAFRARRRLPIVLPPLYLLEPREQAYPPLMSMALGLLPARWIERFYWAVSPLIDALSLALLAFWAGAQFGLAAALAAGAAYSANASLILEFSSLTSRPLALLELNGFLLAGFAWIGGSPSMLPVAIALGVAILYTHKLSAQLLWFLMPFLALAGWDWRWLVPLAASYAAGFAIAPHLFLRILDGHRDIVAYWARNWPLLNAHIVRHSPLYAATDAGGAFYHPHDLRRVARQAGKVLDYNCFIVFAPAAALAWPGLGADERFAACWIAGTYLWGCATYFVRPLRCLGEGNKYFKYALVPSLFLAAALVATAPGILTYSAAAFCAAWTVLSYLLAARRMRAPAVPTMGRLSPELTPLLQRVAGDDGARLMCLPAHLCDLVAYHTRRPVLWGTHGLGFTEAEPFFPVLRRPVEHFVGAYRLTHLLLDRRYAALDELRLGNARIEAQSGDYLLVAFAAAPAA